MRVVVLTSSSFGFGSFIVDALAKERGFEIAAVVHNVNHSPSSKSNRKRKLQKLRKIGILGALNGLRMRKWFTTDTHMHLNINTLHSVCAEYGLKLIEVPRIAAKETIVAFTEAKADIGISLENGYISSKVFGIPKYGMLNIHHEELPAFQNAQSIIWQLHEGSRNTGFTIHQIEKGIDKGDILYQAKQNIDFKQTLGETVSFNYAQLWKASKDGLIQVLINFEEYNKDKSKQGKGGHFTTPTFRQFMKMRRIHRRFREEQS